MNIRKALTRLQPGRAILLAALPLLLCPLAERAKAQKAPTLYVAAEGGIAPLVSGLAAPGTARGAVGFMAGMALGMRFTPALSAELQAGAGRSPAGGRSCCHYWIGNDGERYFAPVPGTSGTQADEAQVRVLRQRYALQANLDLLGFFARTRQGNWSVELSPRLAAEGTKAHRLKAAAPETRWHFAPGGRITVSVRSAAREPRLRVGLYSGMEWLSGESADGLPAHFTPHGENYAWEVGCRLTWDITGRKGGTR